MRTGGNTERAGAVGSARGQARRAWKRSRSEEGLDKRAEGRETGHMKWTQSGRRGGVVQRDRVFKRNLDGRGVKGMRPPRKEEPVGARVVCAREGEKHGPTSGWSTPRGAPLRKRAPVGRTRCWVDE